MASLLTKGQAGIETQGYLSPSPCPKRLPCTAVRQEYTRLPFGKQAVWLPVWGRAASPFLDPVERFPLRPPCPKQLVPPEPEARSRALLVSTSTGQAQDISLPPGAFELSASRKPPAHADSACHPKGLLVQPPHTQID